MDGVLRYWGRQWKKELVVQNEPILLKKRKEKKIREKRSECESFTCTIFIFVFVLHHLSITEWKWIGWMIFYFCPEQCSSQQIVRRRPIQIRWMRRSGPNIFDLPGLTILSNVAFCRDDKREIAFCWVTLGSGDLDFDLDLDLGEKNRLEVDVWSSWSAIVMIWTSHMCVHFFAPVKKNQILPSSWGIHLQSDTRLPRKGLILDWIGVLIWSHLFTSAWQTW